MPNRHSVTQANPGRKDLIEEEDLQPAGSIKQPDLQTIYYKMKLLLIIVGIGSVMGKSECLVT